MTQPKLGKSCDLALIGSPHPGCRYMPKDPLRNPSGDRDCVGAYCVGCPAYPGTHRPTYPTC